MASLFSSSATEPDPGFAGIRDNDTEFGEWFRARLEHLWSVYAPYADVEFLERFPISPQARFWEMYLGFCLIDCGHKLRQPTAGGGPDLGIEIPEGVVWVEAVAASSGAGPDKIEDFRGTFQYMGARPSEPAILRLRSAIEEKHRKLGRYLKSGLVKPSDAYVIAVSGADVLHIDAWERRPPNILQAVLPIGDPVFRIEVGGPDPDPPIDIEYPPRHAVLKKSGSSVATDLFQNPEYAGISAVLFSKTGIESFTYGRGADFITVFNPLATAPISSELFPRGTQWQVKNDQARCTRRELVLPEEIEDGLPWEWRFPGWD